MTTQGQGPLNDPRLIERRGDLSGLNAALFVILVVVAFVAAAFLLASVLHIGGAGASPTPSAVAASVSPSNSVAPSAAPSRSPSPSQSSSPAASAAVGQPIDVVVGGQKLGTVTVVSVQYPTSVGGKTPGLALRWLSARVRFVATSKLGYDASAWSVVDATGTRHAWAGVDPAPALGKGTLKAAGARGGNVTFQVPLQGTLWLAFSGGDGEHRIQLPAQ